MSAVPASTPSAELRHLLRSGGRPEHPFSPQRLLELDRAEAFPVDACRVLDEFGLARHYIPAVHGGALTRYDELIRLLSTVACADLTVAIAHAKTFLGCVCVWIAGTPAQSSMLADEVAKGAVVSWGLTERTHGGDLLAGELRATQTLDGWSVHGEKWLINNATRGHMVCVLGRTGPATSGPREFSLFLIDKRRVAPGSFRCLPKIPTHGIRGADISGIAFERAAVPADALVGGEGDGFEIVLKALQLTRTVCVALSLGAAEHALRLASSFAAQRRLYGRLLAELPQARATLGAATAAMLVAEAVGLVASRSIHALTNEMSVVSSVAKAFVPTAVDELIQQLAELLGIRSFLTEEFAHGAFEKLARDHRIVAIFDGSTIVNRNALINQFPTLARGYRRARWNEDGIATTMSLASVLPEPNLSELSLISSTGSSVVQSLPEAARVLRNLVADGELPGRVAELCDALVEETDRVHHELSDRTPWGRDVPPEGFALAERYERCFAGACCVRLWLHNMAAAPSSPLWLDGLWLEAGLEHVLSRLSPAVAQAEVTAFDRLCDILLHHDEMPVSLYRDLLAGGAP